ncbi:TPA: hypothetical protein N0F65_002190 [Lagenidium giganteum]|uniref:Coiled-coil domain-containing protein 12 n=1 Tax=Lagenidium giganteum TaxID=4803 RepID=A0AAV2YMF9_9STRA|nr:TPA: hypothetical protein N0F65_002190 [Lagenidium giganteum]
MGLQEENLPRAKRLKLLREAKERKERRENGEDVHEPEKIEKIDTEVTPNAATEAADTDSSAPVSTEVAADTTVDAGKQLQATCQEGENDDEEEEEEDVNLAPKRANWDIERDIAPMLKKLEKRTQHAIVEIWREKMAAEQQEEDEEEEEDESGDEAEEDAE